jgi:AhpD family alkylhydroperoxidase
MDHNETIREELRQPALDLRGLIPEVWHGYVETSTAAMRPGELTSLTKELIALSIAITRECDGCIVAHARGCVRQGATRQQVAEAIGVAIAMNGGPGTVWGPRALRAFDEASSAHEATT